MGGGEVVGEVRVLFLSDTHLGFDLPRAAALPATRRGEDFFGAFEQAVAPALRGEADLLLHGGDVFFRSRVREGVVLRALEIFRAVTAAGVPVVILPGNHERSALPFPLYWSFPDLHVIDRPRTVRFDVRGTKIAVSGFPFERVDLRRKFPGLLSATSWDRRPADVRLLLMHQTVEGATVGPADFTFRGGADVLPGRLVPDRFAAVLSGHIHRAQVLRRDLAGRALGTRVLYAGSTERTSFAERNEPKGVLRLRVRSTGDGRGRIADALFEELPARPMAAHDLDFRGVARPEAEAELRRAIARCDRTADVRLRVRGPVGEETAPLLRPASLRRLAPPTMRIEVRFPYSTARTRHAFRQAEPKTPIPPSTPPFSSGWSR
ncbi:MAG: DNA repair exonuclease [Candidatus Eisenbacteria bacterium]